MLSGYSPGLAQTVPYAVVNAETTTLLGRFTVPQSDNRKRLIDNVFTALKSGPTSGTNILAKLDCLQVYAAADAQAASLNWLSTSYTATLVAAPTFTADRGYAGDGAASYVDTNFNPTLGTINFIQNSCTFGFWLRTASGMAGSVAGWFDGADGITISPQQSNANFTARISNATSYLKSGGVTDGRGYNAISRSGAGSGAVAGYRNGVAYTLVNGSASVALNNNNLYMGRSQAASFATDEFGAGFAGGNLSAAEHVDFSNALQAYMTGIGA